MPQQFGRQIGMREKDRGIWQSYTWRQCYGHVRDFALGLAAAGFKRGDKLSVLGDNRARLYWAQLAAQALGGMSVPLYQDSIASELAFVLDHAEVSVVVAEDQEQVDKILSIAGELPSLRLVVYDDPRGMSAYEHPILKSFAELRGDGRRLRQGPPRLLRARAGPGRAPPTSPLIAYTSGTTGRSKGALLSHGNMIATSEIFQAVEPLRRGDNWLCYLPMGWVGDMTYSLGTSMVAGATCNCPESPETVQRDLRELGPTIFLAPPRIWETMLTGLQVKAADASWLKRRVFEYFRALAERCELLKTDGKPIPATTRLGYRLGEVFVYGPVRDQLGLRNARACLTGGAPLGADTFRFFRSFGVNLKQVYGATEACGLVALQGDDEADPNTVGRIVPETQVRIGERGEVRGEGPGRVRRLLQAGRSHARCHHAGRLAQDRRCRPRRSARPARHHRSRQGRRQARRRHAVRAAVHREQAEIQPLHPRGGGVRRPAPVRGGHGRHRHHDRRQMGRAAQPDLYQLHGPRPQAGGGAPDRARRSPRSTPRCRERPRSAASCSSTRSWRPTTPR